MNALHRFALLIFLGACTAARPRLVEPIGGESWEADEIPESAPLLPQPLPQPQLRLLRELYDTPITDHAGSSLGVVREALVDLAAGRLAAVAPRLRPEVPRSWKMRLLDFADLTWQLAPDRLVLAPAAPLEAQPARTAKSPDSPVAAGAPVGLQPAVGEPIQVKGSILQVDGYSGAASDLLVLRLRDAANRLYRVVLAPLPFLEDRAVSLQAGQAVELTALETRDEKGLLLVATELAAAEGVVRLRDQAGQPLWTERPARSFEIVVTSSQLDSMEVQDAAARSAAVAGVLFAAPDGRIVLVCLRCGGAEPRFLAVPWPLFQVQADGALLVTVPLAELEQAPELALAAPELLGDPAVQERALRFQQPVAPGAHD